MSEAGGMRWVKSSYSSPDGANCVEVASLGDGRVFVRDSWQPSGPVLSFTTHDWASCVEQWADL